jgi:hypothetical protein
LLGCQYGQELEERLPGSFVPQIFINSQHIGVSEGEVQNQYAAQYTHSHHSGSQSAEQVSQLNETGSLAIICRGLEVCVRVCVCV